MSRTQHTCDATCLPKVLLPIDCAASRLSISRALIYRYIGKGDLRVTHLGRAARIHRDDLDAFAQQLRDAA